MNVDGTLKKLAGIFVFGAVGGFGYWCYGVYTSVMNGGDPHPRSLLILTISLFLGGISALIGVHYIYTERIENTVKALVLALIFGLSFNTVISSAAKDRIIQAKENEVEGLKVSLASVARSSGQPADVRFAKADSFYDTRSMQAKILVDTINKNESSPGQKAVIKQTEKIVSSIQTAAVKNTISAESASAELTEIGISAVRAEPRIAEKTASAIVAISNENKTRNGKAKSAISAENNLRMIQAEARSADEEELAETIFAKRVQLVEPLVQDDQRLLPADRAEVQRSIESLRTDVPESLSAEQIPAFIKSAEAEQ